MPNTVVTCISLTAIGLLSLAPEPGVRMQTKRPGVKDESLRIPIAKLQPDHVFEIPGVPDWLAIDEHVWVSNSPKNMVARLDHYLPIDRSQMPIKTEVPQRSIEDYAKSGRIFIAGEADDKLLPQEIELLGEDQILYSSDLPHGEGRHNAAKEIIARNDINERQKHKILYDNAVKFFGEP